ncbi:MAG: dolichol-phosphate mannosyltransferase [Candidatus Omnitrophota bacterium]|jgi:dolichol-phosphate mannosyltransferase
MTELELQQKASQSKAEQNKIAVIIPAFNAAAKIAQVIQSIPKYVDEIIVVDDGSTDQTYQIVMNLNHPKVTPHVHKTNQGVGAAMLTGYQKAIDLGADILVKVDSDGQMNPGDMQSILEPLINGRADYAKGNRFADFRTLEKMPSIRRFGNAWLSFLTKLVSGYWNIFDVTNGYTAITADMFKKINPKGIAKGYFFETSMLIELNICLAKVIDVEIPSFYEDEESHLKIHHVMAKFPLMLMRGFCRRFYHRYLLRDFNALSLCLIIGLPLFSFGVLYALSLWISPPVSGAPTPAGTVMLAALPIIMGFQLLLTALILDIVFVPKKIHE